MICSTSCGTPGVGPLEARTISAEHVDLKNTMIVFPPSQAKGKQNERVIFLPENALAICKRLVAAHPTGPIFRNTHGRPWTKGLDQLPISTAQEETQASDVCLRDSSFLRHRGTQEGHGLTDTRTDHGPL